MSFLVKATTTKGVKTLSGVTRLVLRAPRGYEICVEWIEATESFRIDTESVTPPKLTLVQKKE